MATPAGPLNCPVSLPVRPHALTNVPQGMVVVVVDVVVEVVVLDVTTPGVVVVVDVSNGSVVHANSGLALQRRMMDPRQRFGRG